MGSMRLTKIGFAAVLALAMPAIACAADIHAMITGAMKGAMRDLQPRYEQVSGNRLVISWGPSSGTASDAIPVRLQNGEKPEVLIMVEPFFEKLLQERKFAAAWHAPIARSLIGAGVREGAPKPDVSNVDALRNALLAAKTIGYSEGASGVYVSSQLLAKLGIADQVASRMKKITGELVGNAIARGDVEIGLQQVSELKAVYGVSFAGPLPEAVQNASVIIVAVAQDAKEPQAAQSLADFLSSGDCAASLAESGLQPAAGR